MSGHDAMRAVALLVPALWLGFVLGISFMEAPLKFRAPGVTREVALSIGRVVFRALARVELALLALEIAALWAIGWPAPPLGWLAALAAVVVLQQAWLLPALDRRAAAVVEGRAVQGRALHHFYVAGECAKVVLLPAVSWSLITLGA